MQGFGGVITYRIEWILSLPKNRYDKGTHFETAWIHCELDNRVGSNEYFDFDFASVLLGVHILRAWHTF